MIVKELIDRINTLIKEGMPETVEVVAYDSWFEGDQSVSSLDYRAKYNELKIITD